jgi:hypothetical protein
MSPLNGSITLKRSLLRSLLSDVDTLRARLHAIATFHAPRPRATSPPPGYTSMSRYFPPPMCRGGAYKAPVTKGKHRTPPVTRAAPPANRVQRAYRGKGKRRRDVRDQESESGSGESEALVDGESSSGSEEGGSEGEVVVYRYSDEDGMGGAGTMGGPSARENPGMGPIRI